MNNRPIYLFDLGGVIFHLNYQKTYDAFEKVLEIDHQNFFNQFHQPEFFDLHEKGEITDENFFDLVKILNHKATDQAIVDAWNAMLIGIPNHNLLFLERLKKKADLYLLSNTNSIHWKKVHTLMTLAYQKDRFYDCFQKVFLSFELGMRKPEEQIFNHCITEIKAKPQDIIFIDDNYLNIETAKKCGLNAKLYPAGNPLLDESLI